MSTHADLDAALDAAIERDDRRDSRLDREPVVCRWFALCDRPATGGTPHPALGIVPTCDWCAAFARGEDPGPRNA